MRVTKTCSLYFFLINETETDLWVQSSCYLVYGLILFVCDYKNPVNDGADWSNEMGMKSGAWEVKSDFYRIELLFGL